MNVNDLVCVGAEPIAMVDYLAVDQSDPRDRGDRRGLAGRRGGGIEIPGGELADSASSSAATLPRRLDLSGAASARSRSTRWSPAPDRARRPADRFALIRPPLERLYAGPTRARGTSRLDARPALAGAPRRRPARADRIYVKPRSTCCTWTSSPRTRAHHRRRPEQPAATGLNVAYAIDDPLPVPRSSARSTSWGCSADASCGRSSTLAAGSPRSSPTSAPTRPRRSSPRATRAPAGSAP